MLVNDVSLRNLIPGELAKGFGFFQSKPSSSFSPVAITPDELGSDWQQGKVHLPLVTQLNGALFGEPDAGLDMTFNFFELIAHVAKTRPLGAGCIIGSGTVSNYDRSRGSSCLAEQRMLEIIESGQATTPFLRFGDTVSIAMQDRNGMSPFWHHFATGHARGRQSDELARPGPAKVGQATRQVAHTCHHRDIICCSCLDIGVHRPAFACVWCCNSRDLVMSNTRSNLRQGEQKEKAYRRVNPQGLVPFLIDGDVQLGQSVAIMEYLDETYPAHPLMPSAPEERARVRQIVNMIACDTHPLNNLRVLNYLEQELGQSKAARDAWYRHWIDETFTALEQLLMTTAGV